MKKIQIYLLAFFIPAGLTAQVDFSAGMGLSFINNSSLEDYINFGQYSAAGEKLSSFNSAVEFFLEGDYSLNPELQLGVEYALSIFSYTNATSLIGNYEVSYLHHKPSVVAYYVLPGNGYKFKFGGGVGYRFVSLDEKIISTTEYSTSGLGVILKAQGNTILSGNWYANIALDARYDFPGEPKNNNDYIVNKTTDENVNINSLSFGIKLGISYFF